MNEISIEFEDVSNEVAKAAVRELTSPPEISNAVDNYLQSDKCPSELKAYIAGEEKSRERGFSEGFVQGWLWCMILNRNNSF